ncbi:MAG: integrin alpha [Candidatus Midichloria sp.]
MFGKSSFTSPLELSSLNGNNGFIISGNKVFDFAGTSVFSAKDITAMEKVISLLELLVGLVGYGQAYIIFGKSSFITPLELSSLDGTNGLMINGISNWRQSRLLCCFCWRHKNNEDKNDIIIGAPGAGLGGNGQTGQVYIVY